MINRLIQLFVLIIALSSCGERYYGNQARKYCEKWPHNCETVEVVYTDTVFIHTSDTIRTLDTTVVSQMRRVVDSFFLLDRVDTIVIEKGGNTVYIERNGDEFTARVELQDSLIRIIERERIENTRLREVTIEMAKKTTVMVDNQRGWVEKWKRWWRVIKFFVFAAIGLAMVRLATRVFGIKLF